MSDITKLNNLVAAIATMTAAYKVALETRTAPDSLKVGGKTLAEIKSEFDVTTGDMVDAVAQDLAAHIARNDNPHNVTKAQVGLGNVGNFGIATPEEAAAGLRNDVYLTPVVLEAAADRYWADKVGAAPETLDTIAEIAAALNNDPDAVNNIMQLVGQNTALVTALRAEFEDLKVLVGEGSSDAIAAAAAYTDAEVAAAALVASTATAAVAADLVETDAAVAGLRTDVDTHTTQIAANAAAIADATQGSTNGIAAAKAEAIAAAAAYTDQEVADAKSEAAAGDTATLAAAGTAANAYTDTAVAAVGTRVDGVEADADALEGRVGAVELTSTGNTTAIADLTTYVDDAFVQLTAAFDAAAASFEEPVEPQ